MNATIKQREEKRSQCSRSKPTVDPRQLLGGVEGKQGNQKMFARVACDILMMTLSYIWWWQCWWYYWWWRWWSIDQLWPEDHIEAPIDPNQSAVAADRDVRETDFNSFQWWWCWLLMMMGGLYASPFNWFSFFKIRVTFKLVKTLLNITKCLTMEESNQSTNHGERIIAMSFFPPSIAPVNGSA